MGELETCPCCSEKPFYECCAPLLSFEAIPQTPEQLMRSRYTAYSMSDMDYIEKTMRSPASDGFDKTAAKVWADSVQWVRLKILKVEPGVTEDIGYVEFIAYFREGGHAVKKLHEVSEFHRQNGLWYYVNGLLNKEE